MWKTLFGHRIYSGKNAHVYDNGIFRWLTLGSSALQTVLYKRNPQKAGLYYIDPLIIAARLLPSACCLLGLGGGGVVHSLIPFLTDNKLICVEYDEEIITIATRYFQISPQPALTIVHQDACSYLKNCQHQFGHLLVDLFDANHFPASCYHADFFIDCQKSLTNDGLLAVNLANIHEQKPIFDWIHQQFNGATLTIPVKGCANMVIFAGSKQRIGDLIAKLTQSNQLSRLNWDSQWGKVATLI